MTRPLRTPAADSTPADAAAAARFRFERVTLSLDADTIKNYWDPFPEVNRIVLGTGKDETGNSGHLYIIQLSNRDIALPTPYIIVDGSKLQGADFSGADPFFGDAAIISTTHITVADAHITTGGANDSVSSGVGSDVISTGAGDDFVGIGTGNDSVYTGDGDDYIESAQGGFTGGDLIYAGKGTDELSLYINDVRDTDFANVRSVEWLGLSQNGDVELGKEAQRAGIAKLFVDDSNHAITVTADFHRTLDIGNSNFHGGVSIDASASDATILWHAEYNFATTAPTLIGGSGAEDTIFLTSGFSGLPPYGGDLTNMSGFEHVEVLTGTGDAPATVIVDTEADEINAAFLQVDAHTLTASDPLLFDGAAAAAAIHLVAGSGADSVATGTGDDRIAGGLGGDTLTGGAGADAFVYDRIADSALGDIDLLTDFTSGVDRVNVRGLGADDAALKGERIAFFGNVGDGGDTGFTETAGNGALDAVYHSDTHTLWFDTDDDGALGAGDLHLVLASADTIQAADILAGLTVL